MRAKLQEYEKLAVQRLCCGKLTGGSLRKTRDHVRRLPDGKGDEGAGTKTIKPVFSKNAPTRPDACLHRILSNARNNRYMLVCHAKIGNLMGNGL